MAFIGHICTFSKHTEICSKLHPSFQTYPYHGNFLVPFSIFCNKFFFPTINLSLIIFLLSPNNFILDISQSCNTSQKISFLKLANHVTTHIRRFGTCQHYATFKNHTTHNALRLHTLSFSTKLAIG